MLAKLVRKIVPENWRPIGYLTHLTQAKTTYKVQAGPFAGMRYIEKSIGSAYIPKLLGIYERELNPFIEKACQLDIQKIIDIGGGEGYYAVGMALKNPSTQIIVYEMEAKGQDAIAQMAKLNSVFDQIKICGKCELEDLKQELLGNTKKLVICDVEGYELNLLNPDKVPSFKNTCILVELHDFITRGLAEEIYSRFESTHYIKRIWQKDRYKNDFPYHTFYTQLLPNSYIDWAVSEWRPEQMSWFWMEPLK
ncbi:MAG: hypothetical protein V7L29_29500 [Nostoc sp.]|uniref:hypothetical protein n=1 Tax=Nostoc sp. TaxID=1180 RepID=UPI002FFA57E4